MACNDEYGNSCDSGVAAWVIVLIVVLVLKVIFWTIVCYRYHRRRQLFAPRVTVATTVATTRTAANAPIGRGQVAYSGPLAGQAAVRGTAPVYPSATGGNYSVPPPYNPGNYKVPPSTAASAPPAYEEPDEVTNPNAPLLP